MVISHAGSGEGEGDSSRPRMRRIHAPGGVVDGELGAVPGIVVPPGGGAAAQLGPHAPVSGRIVDAIE